MNARFCIRVAQVERAALAAVAAANNLTITSLLRLAVLTLIEDVLDGEAVIFTSGPRPRLMFRRIDDDSDTAGSGTCSAPHS